MFACGDILMKIFPLRFQSENPRENVAFIYSHFITYVSLVHLPLFELFPQKHNDLDLYLVELRSCTPRQARLTVSLHLLARVV